MVVEYKTGCRHCGGTLVREDGEIKCLACSRPATSLRDMKRFYDLHREDILLDIKKIGSKAAREKWRIASSTLNGLIKRWTEQPAETPAPAQRSNNLPLLPEWSDTWPESIQAKWLDIWLYLSSRT